MKHRFTLPAIAYNPRLAQLAAAFASVGAAFVHLAVLPAHLREWLPAGVFFGSIAAFQLGWAALVSLWPNRRLLQLGVLANAGSIALWALSRTMGVPFGPHAGVPEPVTRADLLTAVLEAVICVAALWCLYGRGQRTFQTMAGYLASASITTLAVATVTTSALTGAAGGHSHGGHGHGSTELRQQRDTGHEHSGHNHASAEPNAPKAGKDAGPSSPTGSDGERKTRSDGHDHGSHEH